MLLPTSTVILDCKRNNVGLTEMTTQLECELKQKMKTNVLVEREGNNIHSQKIKDELTNCIHCLLVDVPMYSVHNILNGNSTLNLVKQDNRKNFNLHTNEHKCYNVVSSLISSRTFFCKNKQKHVNINTRKLITCTIKLTTGFMYILNIDSSLVPRLLFVHNTQKQKQKSGECMWTPNGLFHLIRYPPPPPPPPPWMIFQHLSQGILAHQDISIFSPVNCCLS